MTRRAFGFAAVLWLATATATLAQRQEPIGRFVVDVRGATAGLPTAEGWTPTAPTGTVVPSRGLALDAGGHVYVVRWRIAALGVGATWLWGKGTSSAPQPDEGAPPSPTTPDVTTQMTMIAPQLSLNFGHSLGWSYLSAGLGGAHVESEAALEGATTQFVPTDSGWVKTLNYGGGARWFISDRVGVGFDLRWYKVGLVPATDTHPGAPRASLFVAGAGVVLK